MYKSDIQIYFSNDLVIDRNDLKQLLTCGQDDCFGNYVVSFES